MNDTSDTSLPRPSFRELLDYAEGRLSGSDHERIRSFLATHPEAVAADWAWVRKFMESAAAVELHPMPAGLEDRLLDLFQPRTAAAPLKTAGGWIEQIRRVVAELVEAGTMPDVAAAGLRSKVFDNRSLQWTFKTAQLDIFINALVRPDQRFDLHGQVFAADGDAGVAAGSAQLLSDDREVGVAMIDGYGEFVIQGVPAGEYALVIAGEQAEVLCSPVNLAA
jgi:hypothetical protein